MRTPVVVNYINDSRLLVQTGMTGATGNIYTGLHEFEDMGFALHFLQEGDYFIDLGVNVGSYTVLAILIPILMTFYEAEGIAVIGQSVSLAIAIILTQKAL